MKSYTLRVNGNPVTATVDPDTPVLWVLRDSLKLSGTKFGCGIGQCGACTILLDGVAVRSCSLPVMAVGTKEITSIEGLSENGTHPLQVAWDEVDVPQCGYCQTGQIMTAAALIKKNPHPTRDEVMDAMNNNLCRCGTYHRIIEAILKATSKS